MSGERCWDGNRRTICDARIIRDFQNLTRSECYHATFRKGYIVRLVHHPARLGSRLAFPTSLIYLPGVFQWQYMLSQVVRLVKHICKGEKGSRKGVACTYDYGRRHLVFNLIIFGLCIPYSTRHSPMCVCGFCFCFPFSTATDHRSLRTPPFSFLYRIRRSCWTFHVIRKGGSCLQGFGDGIPRADSAGAMTTRAAAWRNTTRCGTSVFLLYADLSGLLMDKSVYRTARVRGSELTVLNERMFTLGTRQRLGSTPSRQAVISGEVSTPAPPTPVAKCY